MADINFDCPHCSQNLDAPEDMMGVEIECPACGETITIADGSTSAPAVAERPGEAGAPDSIPGSSDEESGPFKKSATVRIDLPSDYGIPKPKPRIIKIKRAND